MENDITSSQKESSMVKRWRTVFSTVRASLSAGMVVTMILAGCSSTPAPLPPKVAAGLQDLHTKGVLLKGQIDKTVGALKELTSKPQADPSAQFELFSQELGILEGKVEKAVQQRTAMETVVEDQFLAWEENLKQLRDEELCAKAADRRAATEATYSEIQQKLAELRTVWGPFMADLTDIRQYLNDDLTKVGLQNITPTVNRIYERKPIVIERLDAALETLNNAVERS
jgi:DNA repair exonuclease SbcCD ATPase subunit